MSCFPRFAISEHIDVVCRDWLNANQIVACGGWQDPDEMMSYCEALGVHISSDGLCENNLSIVSPALFGDNQAFAQVQRSLDTIEKLNPRLVIPGHGDPFTDVAAAIEHSHNRVGDHIANPPRHAQHTFKGMLCYHLLSTANGLSHD